MVDDDGKLQRRYRNKRNNAKRENIDFTLTFEEYSSLVEAAGLKSSDLGFSGKNYVLARFNDSGSYRVGNCRFITHMENMKEQKAYQLRQINKKPVADVQIPMKERQRIGNEKKKLKESLHHPSYAKERNSQFGSYWITNGTDNKKWKDDKGEIPSGFYKGRV